MQNVNVTWSLHASHVVESFAMNDAWSVFFVLFMRGGTVVASKKNNAINMRQKLQRIGHHHNTGTQVTTYSASKMSLSTRVFAPRHGSKWRSGSEITWIFASGGAYSMPNAHKHWVSAQNNFFVKCCRFVTGGHLLCTSDCKRAPKPLNIVEAPLNRMFSYIALLCVMSHFVTAVKTASPKLSASLFSCSKILLIWRLLRNETNRNENELERKIHKIRTRRAGWKKSSGALKSSIVVVTVAPLGSVCLQGKKKCCHHWGLGSIVFVRESLLGRFGWCYF